MPCCFFIAIQNLSKWVKPKRVASDLPNKMATCEIRTEPLGLVLILGPWNYPFFTLLNPLIGAIAAGRFCFLLKHRSIYIYYLSKCFKQNVLNNFNTTGTCVMKKLISTHMMVDCGYFPLKNLW